VDQRTGTRVEEPPPRTIVVWDLPTRLFKWSLVFAVILGFVFSSGHPLGVTFLIHVACGYAVTLLLVFRFVWGFIGGKYARFRSFVHGWGSVRAYGERLLRLNPPRTAGHNPVGGWMIMAMLTTLSAIVVTGLLAEGKTGGTGPLSALLPGDAVVVVGDIHAWLGFVIIWLAGLHVAGVLFESLLHRENLVLTMITGRKPIIGAASMDARQPSLWRAVPLVVILGILGAWLAAATSEPPAQAVSEVHMN
jgi:cytochrome b